MAPPSMLSQIGGFLLATAGLALVFGIPAIIIRAWNTRGAKKSPKKPR